MKTNMINAICPICGNELIGDESYDISIDLSECREYVAGHCENCEKDYQWINIFTFSHVEDIKEC